ncbi:RrF2 family transcriptional regulator [Saccharothrix sp. NRRL B-16314]|uniref:RrF2 family transcriptional regulator n=1 Tax=Saccharothrix sp. NRRL B-16314 TaxID=1463825 RepID=UPI000524247B|nr:Rrf2 family transcriptional regulator [Saccharothrix sp. NRRL B-16314]
MKLSRGVEWGLHCAVLLAVTPDGPPVSRQKLAAEYDLPEAYLVKHLHSMVRAGILQSTSGPNGGFRLARPAADITALDVVEAVEGSAPPFTCQEIRRRGRGAAPPELCTTPCTVNSVMTAAHQAWRDSLRGVTVAELLERLPEGALARSPR